MQVDLKAPAKVNLRLSIGEKRPDGYHNIDSIFAAVNIYDKVRIKESTEGPVVNCPPIEGENIVESVITVFTEVNGFRPQVEITIDKRIPIGRGLGGGSSDAAAALIGLYRIFKLDPANIVDLGARIGSDVPFFFFGGIAHVTGRGEMINQLPFRNLKILVVSPPFPVSTAWAYGLLDQAGDLEKVRPVPPESLHVNSYFNTFERIIFDRYPDLYKIKDWLLEQGASVSQLSGSGSAVFGVFQDRIPEEIPFENYELFPCRTIEWGVV